MKFSTLFLHTFTFPLFRALFRLISTLCIMCTYVCVVLRPQADLLEFFTEPIIGAVHISGPSPIKYVTHIGPPHFSSTKPGQNPLCKISLNCSRGLLSGGFCLFPLLSEYIRNNRKLNINFNFRFLMYYKFF